MDIEAFLCSVGHLERHRGRRNQGRLSRVDPCCMMYASIHWDFIGQSQAPGTGSLFPGGQ